MVQRRALASAGDVGYALTGDPLLHKGHHVRVLHCDAHMERLEP